MILFLLNSIHSRLSLFFVFFLIYSILSTEVKDSFLKQYPKANSATIKNIWNLFKDKSTLTDQRYLYLNSQWWPGCCIQQEHRVLSSSTTNSSWQWPEMCWNYPGSINCVYLFRLRRICNESNRFSIYKTLKYY